MQVRDTNALTGQPRSAHSPGQSEPTPNREQRESLLSLCRGAKEEKPRSGLSGTLGHMARSNLRPVRATDDKPNAMKLASIAEVRRRKAIAKSITIRRERCSLFMLLPFQGVCCSHTICPRVPLCSALGYGLVALSGRSCAELG